MKNLFKIVPTGFLVLLAGCSSGASVGNYLWGDDTAPAQTTQNRGLVATNPPASQLPQAPNVAAIQYNGNDPSISAAGRSTLKEPPKNSQRVYVVVNDEPITGYDISQRARLNQALGYTRATGPRERKRALQELIDDVIKVAEAKRRKVNISDVRVDASVRQLAKSGNTSVEGLKARLEKTGVSFSTLRRQIKSSLAMRWLLQAKGQSKSVSVSEAAVDQRLAKISSDPRRQAVRIYSLRMVNLPIEKTSPIMMNQLMLARGAEAQQIAARYKGCSSLRRITKGIYNVQIGRLIEADGRKLPAQMRRALAKAGTKRLIGPMRAPNGIQLIAFCGTRKITPPPVNRAQVKNLLLNEKYHEASERVMRDLRRNAFIDYKVASARP